MNANTPVTQINWYDNSNVTTPVEESSVTPLFMAAFSADRGPENMMILSGENFYKMYGYDISYEKHGQPLLQVANGINNGAKFLCKRIVAPDAALANMIITATITATTAQKKNSAGLPLYTDAATGQETTVADGNEAININVASIKYEGVSVPGVKTEKEVIEEAAKYLDPDSGVYPLFVITDNGRGISYKRFNITADYVVSKPAGFALYSLNNVSTNRNELESCRFSVDHSKIYAGISMSLTMTSKDNLTQISASMIESACDGFIEKISEISGVEVDELKTLDLLFGKNTKGEALSYIVVDQEGYDLTDSLGIVLQEGDNGSFGDYPFGTDEYETELTNYFNGTTTEEGDDDIYDVDKYQIHAVFDANYPLSTKKAITELAKFRQDLFYFADMGYDLTTYESVLQAKEDLGEHTKFRGDYCTSYDVIDPFSKKQVQVTVLYSMIPRLISHFNEKSNEPFCGIKHGFTFPEAIEGTVRYIPKVTRNFNRKSDLCDNLINYAAYLNGVLTLETEYTSQDPYTQLTWINNVTSTQDIIRDIRSQCPVSRYSMITGDDLIEYKELVTRILSRHKNRFSSLEFVYTQDDIMKANKIFKASIYVVYDEFVQAEIFDIYSLSASSAAVTM